MKSKTKFFLKLIMALVPVFALVIFTALAPMCYMDEEYPAWKYTMDVCKNGDFQADTLILGDSRAMADLVPDKLGNNCVNLAVGGATSIEMYYFYQRYLENHPAPETVIVMFAPFHYSYIDNFKTRGLYFNAFSLDEKVEIYRNAGEFGTDSILFDDYAAYNLSCDLKLPDVYLPAIINAKALGRKNVNRQLYEDIKNAHGHGLFGTAAENNEEAQETGYTEMPDNGDGRMLKYYMEKLLDSLEESGAMVILEQPPVNNETYIHLKPEYIAQYNEYIEGLCNNHENIVFSSEMVAYDSDCFGDPSHLNEKGANRFSEEFYTKYIDFL